MIEQQKVIRALKCFFFNFLNFIFSANRLTSSSLLQLSNVLTTWPTKLRQISICKNPLLDFSTVRENLLKVFNVVIVEPFVDSATMYADYLSEM